MSGNDSARDDLIRRIRTGDYSASDLDVLCRSVQRTGIPPTLFQDVRNKALRTFRELKYRRVNDVRTRARLVLADLGDYVDRYMIRKHAHAHVVPDEIKGTPDEQLWIAAKHGAVRTGAMGCDLISEGQLRRILA